MESNGGWYRLSANRNGLRGGDMQGESSNKRRLTRRHVLRTSAAALGAGTGLLGGPPVLGAQSAPDTGHRDRDPDGPVVPRPRSPRQHPRRAGDAAPADRPAAGSDPFAGGRALLHDRTRRAQHQPRRPRGGPEPLRLRRRRGHRTDGEARPGWRSGCRRRHVAVRAMLPVPAGTSRLLPVHVFLERAGRRSVSSLCSIAGRHACIRRRPASGE